MIRKILVPVDGSKMSESILPQVRRLLLRQSSDVVLLRVKPANPLPPREESTSALRYLEELRGRLCASGVPARDLLLDGDPAAEILASAKALRPWLIAMSTHGRGGVGRLVRGSVAEHVLRHASQPLLLASPKGLDDHRSGLHAGFRRILVPLDGTARSEEILPMVREFATVFESQVTLLHVSPPLVSGGMHQFLDFPVDLERPRTELEEAGIRTSVRKEIGLSDTGILQAVREVRADLVAMTTHGRSGISRWILGSVAEEVLRHCPVPILVHRSVGTTEPASLEDRSDRDDLDRLPYVAVSMKEAEHER